MRFSSRIVIIAVAALALAGGLVIGLWPFSAPLTQISPVVKQLTVRCGIGYLPTIPPAGPGDLVSLAGEPDVALPRATYAEHCEHAVRWWPYAAWGLTGLGLAGLAVLLAGGRAPAGAKTGSGGGNTSGGGQHREGRRRRR